MKNLKYVVFAVLALMVTALPIFAQGGTTGAADNASTVEGYRALAAGIGFAIAAGLGAIGQSRIGAAAVEGAARNPNAAGKIQTMMILGLALIESLVLFMLVIVFVVLNK
ncbi:MAG: hypothetical protein H7Z37_09080 [Pyrinomonadaceae bacterium]|nr:hypothetical protein [Pyrinomonadaceae bacterium]